MPEDLDSGNEEKMSSTLEDWVRNLDQGKVEEVDIPELRAALEAHGANFAELGEDDRRSLRKFSNAGKANGVRAVWDDKFSEYKRWTDDVADGYPEGTLPHLEKSGSDTAGMKAFFGELTALAAGEMSIGDFRKYEEVRIQNGIFFAEGHKDERLTIVTPTSEGKPIKIASVPPGFPSKAWSKIMSW